MKISISRNKREGWYCAQGRYSVKRYSYNAIVRTKLKSLTLKHKGRTTGEDYEAYCAYFY